MHVSWRGRLGLQLGGKVLGGKCLALTPTSSPSHGTLPPVHHRISGGAATIISIGNPFPWLGARPRESVRAAHTAHRAPRTAKRAAGAPGGRCRAPCCANGKNTRSPQWVNHGKPLERRGRAHGGAGRAARRQGRAADLGTGRVRGRLRAQAAGVWQRWGRRDQGGAAGRGRGVRRYSPDFSVRQPGRCHVRAHKQ